MAKVLDTDYAFEMAASNIRYGPGVTAEVGMDFKNMKARKGMIDSMISLSFSLSDYVYICLSWFPFILNYN
jgi:hypothetical protein